MTVAATIPLDRFDRPDAWRQTRRCLLAWQTEGRAHVVAAGIPVDVATIARADSHDHLLEMVGVTARANIMVFDPKLAHGLIRLAAETADRDRDGPAL